MNNLDIQFLGTSSGVPTKQRNVSATVIKQATQKDWFLVDCGEATQHQLLHTAHSLNNLQGIAITHVHGDHCYGLPGLLASSAMSGRTEPLTIIAPDGVRQMTKAIVQCTNLHLPYSIYWIDVVDIKQPISFPSFEINATTLSHRVPSYAFSFTATQKNAQLNVAKLNEHSIPRGPLWGQIQRGESVTLSDGRILQAKDYLIQTQHTQKVIVGGDNDQPELLKEACIDAQVLIHEATYTQSIADKVGPGPQHSSAQRVAQFAESVSLKNLVLTHFSARYQMDISRSPSIQDIEQEAKAAYRGNLFLAEDFSHFRLNESGELNPVSP